MTEADNQEWTALLNKLGVHPGSATPKTDAGRRVDRMLPRVSEAAPDLEIALALLTAAASGPLRKNLGEIHTRSSTERAGLSERLASGPPRRPSPIARLLARLGLRESVPARSLDARIREETAVAIAAAPASQFDRAAAIDGVRRLLARGRLPAERAEGVLRALHYTD